MPVSTVEHTTPNGLLRALRQAPAGSKLQKAQVGAWNSLPGMYIAKILGSFGFKWVLVDCEHGNISDNEMHIAVQTLASSGVSPVVRMPASDSWMIKRALDAGAHAIMLPMCESAAQAQAIVTAAKYPSHGIRGAGSFFAGYTLGGMGIGEYIDSANRDTMVIVQIESPEGLRNVDDIAAVEGIDCIFIGPADLSLSMGFPAMAFDSEPTVQDAIKTIRESAHAHGKFCGIYTGDAKSALRREAEGFELVTTGGDMLGMMAFLGAQTAAFKDGC